MSREIGRAGRMVAADICQTLVSSWEIKCFGVRRSHGVDFLWYLVPSFSIVPSSTSSRKVGGNFGTCLLCGHHGKKKGGI